MGKFHVYGMGKLPSIKQGREFTPMKPRKFTPMKLVNEWQNAWIKWIHANEVSEFSLLK